MFSQKEYFKDWYAKNKQVILNHNKRWQHDHKQWFIDIKSKLCCSECGEQKICCLDFHHRNPNEKELNISRLMSFGKTKILNEMTKCIVLCSNCHRKVHNGLIKGYLDNE